jgi:putative salt-induced outer membrane protein YdiY
MRGVLTCAIIALAVAAASADEVVMKNGDRFTGTITGVADGRLTIETSYGGVLTVDFAEVASFKTEGAFGVDVSGGSRVVGPVEYQTGARAAVVADEGRFEFDAADLLGVGPAVLGAPETPKWHGAFEVGVAGRSGNKESFSGNAKLSVERKTDDLTITGYASGRYAEEDGEVSQNLQRVGGRTESRISDVLFWYVSADFLRDEFKDLNLRATGSAGLGRTWWEAGEDFWKTAAGVGFTHESYSTGGNDIFPVAELVSNYGKRLRDGVVFTDTTRLIPNLDDFDGWRAENDAAFAIDLDDNGDWKLKLGVENTYDADPPDDVERLETFYYLNAVRAF